MVSGLKINFAKSSFGAIGMPNSWKQNAANFLNCNLLTIPFVYLGIPMGQTQGRVRCGIQLFKNFELNQSEKEKEKQ